ncbi:ABC transporter ATP-binding protein [Phytohabitans sp. LJ34]|uniref:ABC transporter ATP-binding protein n=1 Tax=Phytohabitans sp. LJ34 TaxID=3452217 RepID=UPI003F8CB298
MTGPGAGTGSLRAFGHAVGICVRAAPGFAVLRLVASLVAGLGPVAVAWLTKVVLDALAASGGQSIRPVAALAAVVGLLAVVGHFMRYVDREIGRRVIAYTQDRLFRAVSELRLPEMENPAVHDRLRLAQQASSVGPQQLTNAVLAIAQVTLTVGGFVVSLAAISPFVVALVAASAAPSLYAQLSLARDRSSMMLTTSPRLRRQAFYYGLLLDLRAAKEIRLFGLGDFLRGRMLTELRGAQAGERRVDRRTVRVDTLFATLTAGVSAVALLVGAAQIAAGGSVGDFSVLIAALTGVQGGLAGIVGQIAMVHQTLILFGHYVDVVGREARPAQRPPAAAVTAVPLRRGIELHDVWFRYHPSHDWVLRGLSLTIPHGQSTALVGLNGAGKSTLVKLLCLLYEPQRGRITWDGVDIREMDPAQVRRRIAVVFQDYMTYDLSAADNIGVGNLDALGDEPRVREAAAFAGVHQTLASLPMGYDTTLSRTFVNLPTDGGKREAPEVGVPLSGGQWQRVALARAVLRDDADLLILDEPSAGLDVEAEAAVHAKFQDLRERRTSLLISHRMNTIRTADRIVVLDNGRIVEEGSHDELMLADARYAALFRTQASGYQIAVGGER